MRIDIVFTLSGPDRVGIVEEITREFFELGGNVGTSRMSRLGGEFAMIMLVSIPADRLVDMDCVLVRVTREGYAVNARQAEADTTELHAGWRPYIIEVVGADHEGIVHDIAAGLSSRGITIESMDTDASEAPVSGAPLFSMRASVLVPPEMPEEEWTAELAAAATHANVDVTVTAQ